MKKLYLVGGLAALTLTINAQNTDRSSYSAVPAQLEQCTKAFINADGTAAYAKGPGDVFWSEDFSGGIPVGWSVVDNNGMGYDWILNSTAVTAAYTGANGSPISSTSGGNHMLLFGDGYNTIGGSGGVDPLASFTAMDAYFQSAPISMGTGYNAVSLQWQQKLRFCCTADLSAFTVVVSRDAAFTPGATTVSYEANQYVDFNDNSDDPMNVSVDISAVAGGMYTGDIYIRFHQQQNSHYFWMVDDIELMETPNNDLKLLDGFWANTTGSTTPYIPYSMIPQSQLNDIDFYGVVRNNGGVDQPNTTMTATVSGAASATYASAAYSSVAQTSDTVMSGPMVGAGSANGSYSVAWSVASDSTDFTPIDNVISDGQWDFEVNNSVYARDAGALNGSYSTRDFDGDGLVDPVEFFLDYQFYNADTVLSIAAVFPGGSDNSVGQELKYNIYDPAGNPVYDGITAMVPSYTLTAGDLTPSGAGSEIWVNLPLTNPLTGNAGYPVDPALGEVWTVSIFNEFDSLFVGVSGVAMAVGGSWTTAGVSWYPLDGSAQDYYTTDCFMMRLNLATVSTGLNEDEIGANLGQNIPNPFNGSTMVPFTLSNSANVEFVVMDVTGKIVEKQGLGKLQAGQHNVTFASNDLAGGIYYYSVIVDGIRTTKKMAVAK
jgi:hypothetical protein